MTQEHPKLIGNIFPKVVWKFAQMAIIWKIQLINVWISVSLVLLIITLDTVFNSVQTILRVMLIQLMMGSQKESVCTNVWMVDSAIIQPTNVLFNVQMILIILVIPIQGDVCFSVLRVHGGKMKLIYACLIVLKIKDLLII